MKISKGDKIIKFNYKDKNSIYEVSAKKRNSIYEISK
jgi:hypothetical protein